MKFELEIEATPAEARAFLGLPDLTPLHEAWVERMKSFATNGATPEDWQAMMRQWSGGMSGVNESLEAWQKLMTSAMSAPLKSEPGKKE